MIELHTSEPARWTAVALATRYGATTEAAAACVSLAGRRGDVTPGATGGDELASSSDGPTVEERRKAVAAAWGKLEGPGDVGLRSRGRSAMDAGNTEKSPELRFRLIDEVFEAVDAGKRANLSAEQAAAAGDDIDSAEAPSAAEADGPPEGVAENVAETDKSDLQKWVDELIASGGGEDIKRKTSYAFIEAGVPNTSRRAVWIRDGPTGKIRAPTEGERSHLLGEKARTFKSRRKV